MSDRESRRKAMMARKVRHARHTWKQVDAVERIIADVLETDAKVIGGGEGPFAGECPLPVRLAGKRHRYSASMPWDRLTDISCRVIAAIVRTAPLPRDEYLKGGGGHGPRVPMGNAFAIGIHVEGPATFRAAANAELIGRRTETALRVATWLRRHRNAALAAEYLQSVTETTP